MTSSHPRTTLLTLLVALAGFCLLADRAQAQAQQRRLVLDIELQRQGPVQAGADRGEQKLSQRWQLSALLQSDGAPIPYNPLDPEDHRRQLQAAQSAQSQAQRMATAATMAPMPDVAAMQAKAQALMARCGQDSACLMREASALTAATMPASTQGRLQAYGNAAAACERQPAGKPREACQANARRQAGGGVDAPEVSGPATPYLLFTGAMACGLQLTARLDDHVQGRFNDVQGVVSYTETAQGSETRRDDLPCPTLQAVLDTRNGRVWTALSLVPQDVQGVQTREETNRRAQRHEGRIGLRWMEAQAWLQQRLVQLSSEGQDQARLPAGAGGQAEIKMKWSFRPA
ncbi:hypothetical protein [Roseateles sp. P5_E7]